MARAGVGGDVFLKARARVQEPPHRIVCGNVVIARSAHHRAGQAEDELAGRGELPAPRTLREIAADRDEIGTHLFEIPAQGFHHAGIGAAEVEVREVRDPAHRTIRLPPPAAGRGS
jgi:hypothetical protein